MEEKKVRVSLKDFIEEHYKLYTVMGVLGALIALFMRIEVEFAQYVVINAFIMFLMVNVELWIILFRASNRSPILLVFSICQGGILSSVSGLLVSNYWEQLLTMTIMSGLLIALSIPIILVVVYVIVYFKFRRKRKKL